MIKKLFILLVLTASALASYRIPLNSFNTGQISPLMEGRVDFQKYNSSCRTLENMFVTVHGPVIRRPGTKYIATAKSGTPRVISFEHSVDDVYVIEMGNLYMRFYREGGQILDPNNDPYEIVTVYDSNEIWNVQFAQDGNTMYLVDGNDIPQILTRSAHASWIIEDANFTTGPFMPENTTDVNIAPSATTGSITLEASGDIFDSGHVGSLWQINQTRNSPVMQGALDANESSSESYYFIGGYSFTTEGTWNATVTLERSTDDGSTWLSALTPLNSINFDNPAETEDDGAIYRVTMSDYVSGTCEFTLTIADTLNKGIVKISAFTDANTVTATVLTELVDTNSTTRWREGYWSDYRGWPKTVAFHQQRLVFGGSESYPQIIWFGKTDPDEYENFTEGTLDTSAFTIALPDYNPINWLLSQDYLLIGTSGSCGKYGGQGEAITPTSPAYQQQSKHGSNSIKAVFAGDSILYVERGSRKIREFSYNLQFDKYVAYDLTILSEDITSSRIKEAIFQMRPDPVMWNVLNSGDIATLTFQRKQEVIGWSKQTTDGDFKSVTFIPSDDEDEVWVVVERTIDGSDVSYIEQFQSRDWGTDQNDCWFVDSGLSRSGDANDTFYGLDHLEGETVSVYADGIIQPDVTVSSGSVTINAEASNVIIGLAYTSKFETLPITIDPQDRIMSKKINSVNFDFYETGYCQYGNGANSDLTDISFYESATISARYDLYTSDVKFKRCLWPFGSMRKQTVYVQSDKPMPLCIRAMIIDFNIYP